MIVTKDLKGYIAQSELHHFELKQFRLQQTTSPVQKQDLNFQNKLYNNSCGILVGKLVLLETKKHRANAYAS